MATLQVQPSLTRHHLEQVQSSKSGKVSHLMPPSAASCHRRRLRNADVSSLFALGGSCRASIVVTVRKGELQQMDVRCTSTSRSNDVINLIAQHSKLQIKSIIITLFLIDNSCFKNIQSCIFTLYIYLLCSTIQILL